jgi:Fe-S-cluster containining protein
MSPEAFALAQLVESLPEPRREEIRARFADGARRLKEAGLHDAFMHRPRDFNREAARQLAHAYFRQGIVCPFLEDDACSIYPDRPFVCRQYLVTSAAELCSDPFENPVRPIPIPVAPAHATLFAAEHSLGTPQHTVPLVLALDYVESRRRELEQTFPTEALYRRYMAGLLQERPACSGD